MTTKQAIEQVLTGKRKPMTVAEIAEAVIPLSNLRGQTPKQVIYSVLYSENKRADGLVTRVDARTFKAQPQAAEGVTDLDALVRESYVDDVQAVAGEFARAADAQAFGEALRELVELASSGRVLVADEDALLAWGEAGTFRLTVEPT